MNRSLVRDEIAVILVNYQSADDIERHLTSGAIQGTHIILVDNDSQRERIESLSFQFNTHYLFNAVNVGFARAVNGAISQILDSSMIKAVLLLNPDVYLANDTLDRLAQRLAESGADGVAPLLIEPSGRLQVGAAGGPISWKSIAVYFLFLSHLMPCWRGLFLTRRQSMSAELVDWLCAACLLTRTSTFKRFGLIPQDEFMYAEDIAWGTLVTQQGGRLLLAPEVTVQHAVGSSGGGNAWIGALERLVKRRQPGLRGYIGIFCLRFGLYIRRALGRNVDARRIHLR